VDTNRYLKSVPFVNNYNKVLNHVINEVMPKITTMEKIDLELLLPPY
jgi:hypothetical protein